MESISKGPSEEVDSKGNNILHRAVQFRSTDDVHILLIQAKKTSININAVNKQGQTPLDLAENIGDEGMMGVLKEFGAKFARELSVDRDRGYDSSDSVSLNSNNSVPSISSYTMPELSNTHSRDQMPNSSAPSISSSSSFPLEQPSKNSFSGSSYRDYESRKKLKGEAGRDRVKSQSSFSFGMDDNDDYAFQSSPKESAQKSADDMDLDGASSSESSEEKYSDSSKPTDKKRPRDGSDDDGPSTKVVKKDEGDISSNSKRKGPGG